MEQPIKMTIHCIGIERKWKYAWKLFGHFEEDSDVCEKFSVVKKRHT